METVIETLWRRSKNFISYVFRNYIIFAYIVLELLECKEKDFKNQLTKEQEKLTAINAQVSELREKETVLASQNAKQSTELVAAEKQQQLLNNELSRVKNELKLRNTELGSLSEDKKYIQEKSAAEINTLSKTGVEQSKIIKEYQEKVQ